MAIVNAIVSSVQGRKQREWEAEKQAIDNQFQLDMWNMQNEYNSPQAQMQRFQDAGLSPQLVYSQGTSGNATSAPDLHAPEQNFRTFPGVNPLNTIKDMLAIKNIAEEVKQNQVKTWFETMTAQDLAAQQEAKYRIGGAPDSMVFAWRKPSFFKGASQFAPEFLTDFYQKQTRAGLSQSLGKGKLWDFKGKLADRGLSEKDHFLWRFATQNAPKTMDTIFKDILSIDQILSKGLNGLGTFLGL